MKHIKQFQEQKPDWESSIYVRGSEGSMADYQFVIAGPRDTPYDNGLFLFQMKLPPSYPTIPPFVELLTTGAGRYRINPNLYSGGKVCLDLLGTFGYAWTSKSNMVQVLLAIQAQIMVEIPLRNEPSFSTILSNSIDSVIYNALQRIITMKIGMIGPMTNPYTGYNDLICKFFFGPKRLEIIQHMYSWVQAAQQITIDQCSLFISGNRFGYIAGSGNGAGGGVGLLPSMRIKPKQLQEGIVEMTKSHASKVLSLLYAQLPSAWQGIV
jgi:ubiquitin-protein ligase